MTDQRPTRRTLLGVAGTAALVGRSAVASTSRRADDRNAPAPLTLAALFPASGAQALAGDEAWRGVALAVAAHRAGRPIRLIRADATDPPGTIAALAKSAAPAAFLGTLSSTRSFAATAAAELANIPYIELDAPADGITARGFKSLLRTGLTTTDLAAVAATAIAGQIAPAWHQPAASLRIGLLFDVGATNGAFAAAMLGVAKSARLPIRLSMGYATDSMDFAARVSRMQRARIDLLIHAGRTEHVLLLYQALAIAAWRPRMIIGIGTGYGVSALDAVLGRAIDNSMVVGTPLYSAASAGILRAYRDRYAAEPRSSASLTSYVGTSQVLAALGTPHPPIAALRASHLPRGGLANGWGVRFDATGQNQESFATLQQWRGGRLVTIDPTVAGAEKPILSL